MSRAVESVDDRELVLLATTLERLAARVESQFNADASEGAAPEAGDLLSYTQKCLDVLDDPTIAARLRAACPSY